MSDLWTRKIKTAFKRFDIDGDGFMTEEDWKLMAERFIEKGDLSDEDIKSLRHVNRTVTNTSLMTPKNFMLGALWDSSCNDVGRRNCDSA